MPKSILAVFVGLVTIVALSVGTDLLLARIGVNPPFGQRLPAINYTIAVGYRILYGILGCFITALLAPGWPMQHAIGLGVVGLAIGITVGVAMWDAAPAWFTLTITAINVPAAWPAGNCCKFQARVACQ